MPFQEDVKTLSEKALKNKERLLTEESVKHSLIMPFIQLLGYDIFDPSEVIPEYIADLGTKKGEKIDYAILIDNEPRIIIEAKGPDSKLEDHFNQLYRYFNALGKAKFAILTNGISYQIYTDLDEPNKMDIKPFLVVDYENLKEQSVIELEKFTKKNYNTDLILSTANELKYTNQIKEYLTKQIKDPDEEFIKFIIKNIYDGRITPSVVLRFEPIVKKSVTVFINELINDKIKAVLIDTEKTEQKQNTDVFDGPIEKKPTIVTTDEEIEGYTIIKILLKKILNLEHKVTYKDTSNYFIVMLDEKSSNWICRLRLGQLSKSIEFRDGEKQKLDTVEDIEKHKEKLEFITSSLIRGGSFDKKVEKISE